MQKRHLATLCKNVPAPLQKFLRPATKIPPPQKIPADAHGSLVGYMNRIENLSWVLTRMGKREVRSWLGVAEPLDSEELAKISKPRLRLLQS